MKDNEIKKALIRTFKLTYEFSLTILFVIAILQYYPPCSLSDYHLERCSFTTILKLIPIIALFACGITELTDAIK